MTVQAVLGVDRSISGFRWESRGAVGSELAERTILALSQRYGLPDLCARVLVGRGISLETAQPWLQPSIKDQLPDPSHLKDMDLAVDRLVAAVKDGETIGVLGDYDVDGATSSALVLRYLKSIGVPTALYIPNRDEGYGPNPTAFRSLKEQGAKVVLTVDCGATAHAPLEAARALELDVIVSDHHIGEPALPPALAVVNPNRFDEDSPHRQMAACGVTFLLLVGLNRALRRAGFFDKDRSEPRLLDLLDLVALGTVADVVPLTGINRTFVTQGLKVMAQRLNPGLTALADVAGLSDKPSAFHLGYMLGPRINAGGRLGDASQGTALLSTDNPEEARQIAKALDVLNSERRAVEADVLELAVQMAEDEGQADRAGPVLVAGEGWHPGVIGIVASRLKDRFNRPALVVGLEGGIGSGSGRSLPGIDLGSHIIAARQAGLLEAGGGHAMAAGFTVAREKLLEFQAFMDERIGKVLSDATWSPTHAVDAQVSAKGASSHLITTLEKMGPFGSGNPEPRFVIPNAQLDKVEPMGRDHVRCFVSGSDGGKLKAVAWRCIGTPLGEALLASRGKPLHLLGALRIDPWGGYNRPQLTIEDAAWS